MFRRSTRPPTTVWTTSGPAGRDGLPAGDVQYKVYIIDEVHMLSTSAFNALLKTMEEPPEHVIFILATTEVQKVPATILSRCSGMTSPASRPRRSPAGWNMWPGGKDRPGPGCGGTDRPPGRRRHAGRALDPGHLRRCFQYGGRSLVRRMAGVTDRRYLFEISDAIAAGDAVRALQEIARCASSRWTCAGSAWNWPATTAT